MEPISRLSSRVLRITGMNPGPFTLDGSCTYLLGTGEKRIVIDTGEGKAEYETLLKGVLDDQSVKDLDVIFTHWHNDHVGGYQSIKRLRPAATFWKKCLDQSDPFYSKTRQLQDGQLIRVEGAQIRVIETPGHTEDHISLYFEEETALFSGDCILGRGSAVFEDLKTYMDSLVKLSGEKIHRIYPGHGEVVENGNEKIEQYINHRNAREKQILDVLKSASAMSSMGIVEAVYVDTPRHLYRAAQGNVMHHLSKLIKEGIVQELKKDSFAVVRPKL